HLTTQTPRSPPFPYTTLFRSYGDATEEIRDRTEFELDVITRMGYAGYFLIVQDFIGAARGMGISVGPGRGSAAGSLVAFATGIRSEEHTSELQSRGHLVCRLL